MRYLHREPRQDDLEALRKLHLDVERRDKSIMNMAVRFIVSFPPAQL